MERPLISILVPCFNNQQFIYENLESIFSQTYPKLEILIGDDASPKFNAEALINWINPRRTPNIKKISIYHWEENLGTVANLERLRERSEGEYLFDIAADDAIHNSTVIERFYDEAVKAGDRGEFLVAQPEFWDQGLKNKMGVFMKQDMIDLIQNGTPRDLFAECSWHACLPATNFYRRDFVEKIGKLSDRYRLVEDWPTHLRLTRMGIQPIYVDMPCIKHRDGGISHGNTVQSQKAFITYYQDLLSAYRHEMEPYAELLTESERERAQNYYQDRVRAYYRIHLPKYMTQQSQTVIEKKVENNTAEEKKIVQNKDHIYSPKALLRETIKQLAMTASDIRIIIGTGMLCALCFIAAACLYLCGNEWMGSISAFFLCCGTVLLIGTAMEIVLNVWLQVRHFLQDLRNL